MVRAIKGRSSKIQVESNGQSSKQLAEEPAFVARASGKRKGSKKNQVTETAVQRVVQQNVQEQLTERGEFSPIELLISIGRLLYVDYEDWRRGKVKTLDKVFVNLPVVKSLLQEADAYAVQTGLVRESIEWTPWIERSVEPLIISEHTDLNQLLSCRYIPQRHQFQLDLFYDNGVTSSESRVILAFVDGSLDDVERTLAELYRADASHPELGLYEHLQRYMKYCCTRSCQPDALVKEFHVLTNKIVPLAHAALKSRARDFLAQHWIRLINCCKAIPYGDRPEEVNLSRLYWEVGDWGQVVVAGQEELAHRLSLDLLVRIALAYDRLSQLGESYQVWFFICWHYPESFPVLVVDQPDGQLQTLWSDFIDIDEGEDEEGMPIASPPATHFPAFCLLKKPQLSEWLSDHWDMLGTVTWSSESSEGQLLYQVAYQLCKVDNIANLGIARDHAERSIELRKRLSDLSPVLMKLYLETHFA